MCLFAFFRESTWKRKRRKRNLQSSPPPKCASLENNANNCWFNATVQALVYGAFGDWLFGKPLRKKPLIVN